MNYLPESKSSEPAAPRDAIPYFVSYNTRIDDDCYEALIYAFHHNGPLHRIYVRAHIDLATVVSENKFALIRSSIRCTPDTLQSLNCDNSKRFERNYSRYLFKMPDDTFLIVETNSNFAPNNASILCFSANPETASRWARDWLDKYHVTIEPKSTFSIVSLTDKEPKTSAVEITRTFALSDKTLSLYYGNDCPAWESRITDTMSKTNTGTLILQGSPGTGKTTFIRHLVDKLKRTHRFYYLPVTQQELLTSPSMVEFWVGENKNYAALKKVIILEDAELLLERSQHGRTGAIANLLNIADGLLGELLKVQVLCTVNCPIGQLDEAIVRPGRLLGFREFSRIPPARASLIAAEHNIQIPDLPDYALSDIFAQRAASVAATKSQHRVLGFASAS